MPRKQLQARFDPDVVESVEDYADDHDISRSEAMRRMLRAGLSANDYQVPVADGIGTGDDLEALRDDLSRLEQRQMEIHEQRNRRIRRTWAGAAVAGVLYVIGGLFTTFPPAFVAAGGVIVLAALALATSNLSMIEGADDE